jgi:subtilisin family serine protease
VGVIDAVLEAQSRGIVVVAAAGNWNRDEPREYPAMDDDIPSIGVAATDDNDVKGGFSNYNERLYISAPGTNAFASGAPIASRSMVSALPGGVYGFAQGTSMATPIVSGAVALIRAQHPEWLAGPAVVTTIRNRLRNTAENINAENPGLAGELGHGRIDVGAAVELGPIAPGPGDVTNDGVVNVSDLLIVIADWGQVHSSADMNGSGVVDVSDLLLVIAHWG